ncbi:cellulose binding domain-containing protein [Marinagarivorans algicola]|uniref:cellulose binding domain-containing protein n=1 Tax=Marinagarivorans algicola TaxID=1513270 RepID=UPI003736B531
MHKRLFRDGMLILIVSVLFIQHTHAAQCEYNIINDWGSGFQAEIKITNNDAQPINTWTVGWEYSDGSALTGSWNATVSDSSPYTASALVWNASIAMGESVAFGFTGTNGKAAASVPIVTGDVCNTGSASSAISSSSLAVSSSSIAISSSSVASSVPVSSSSITSSSSSASNGDIWRLDANQSHLNFTTTKKIHIVENMRFTRLSGAISESGSATLVIDLASVVSGITVRDERMKNSLFETSIFSTAVVTLPVDMNALSSIPVGQSLMMNVVAELSLHGVTNDITTNLKVSRLTASTIMVKNVAPIIVLADDYDLESGVETLKALANLSSIGKAVPVDFTLFYNAL